MPDLDPRWVDGLQAVLLLGIALLAWREFRAIRAKMKADKDRRDDAGRDDKRQPHEHSPPGD